MADTLTVNYKWVQPQVGGDAATWGATLNNDLAAIDAQVYANQQGLSPIGAIIMFGGYPAPPNWWLCDGTSISTSGAGAALFAVIGYTYGGSGANFNLPNFSGLFPTGALASVNPIGKKAGSNTATLSVANLPAHNHGVNDPQHVHGVAQTAHSHGVNDPQHTHGVNDPQHAHNIAGSMGYGVGAITPPTVHNSGAGPMSTLPAPTGVTIAAAAAGVTVQPQNANITINSAATGITTTNTGSGTPVPTVPSYLAVSFCIRYQ